MWSTDFDAGFGHSKDMSIAADPNGSFPSGCWKSGHSPEQIQHRVDREYTTFLQFSHSRPPRPLLLAGLLTNGGIPQPPEPALQLGEPDLQPLDLLRGQRLLPLSLGSYVLAQHDPQSKKAQPAATPTPPGTTSPTTPAGYRRLPRPGAEQHPAAAETQATTPNQPT